MHRHFILHKPYNCLSQFIYEGKRKASKHLLGELFSFPKGIMAIGRLDEKSEGLLLLTTDGKISELIRSSKFEKEYYVQVGGLITEEAIKLLIDGVEIGFDRKKYLTKKCKAKLIDYPSELPIKNRKVRSESHGEMSWLSITLKEGKFRQVRKMTAAVGFPTFRLIRVRVGSIFLNLPEGAVQEVKTFFKK